MATYVPVLGDFSAAAFSLVNGAAAAVARDGTAQFQGDPRPGVMRWVFELRVPDADAANETTYTLQVLSPYTYVNADFNTRANSFSPIVSIVPGNTNGGLCVPVAIFNSGAADDTTQRVAIAIALAAPQDGLAIFQVSVDFSNTLIS